jgi:hypothetical protein
MPGTGGVPGDAVTLRAENARLRMLLDHGAFDLPAGDNVVVARTGDLLVVPPGTAYAFAAHHDSTAEALIIATPGIERFDYFRHVARRRQGSEPPEMLLGLQDRFDTTFSTVPPGSAPARPPDRTRKRENPMAAGHSAEQAEALAASCPGWRQTSPPHGA